MPRISSRVARAAMLIGIASGALMIAPEQWSPIAFAAAQERPSIRADFRAGLEPFGAWRHHARFGDVWVPGHRSRAWRPYTAGHWVYTDDYGWYWVEDTQEADWGWITYHYGHWYRDPDFGWIWIPGDEWAPAWVDWREGDDYVGWAPAPPDDYVVEVDDDPGFWSFVTINNLVAPSIAAVLLPQPRVFFNRTFIVNRDVIVRDRGPRFAVNPGIPATFVASHLGRPLRTFDVHPRILAGTANLRGATEVRAEDLRQQRGPSARRFAAQTVVQPSRATIQSTRSVPPPQPLARGEPGRLGATAPLAARGQEGRRLTNAPAVQRPGGTAPPPTTAEERRTPGAAATTGQQPNERRGAERLTPGTPPATQRTGEAATRRPGNIEQGTVARGSTQARRPELPPVPEVRKPQPPATAERRPVEHWPRPAASLQREVKPPPAATPRPTPPPKAVARPAPPPAARPSPPPAAVARPAPPPAARPSPPPAAVARPSPPPAPRPSPPPAAVARPAPPPAARPSPPPVAAAHPPAPATTGAAPPGRKPQQ